MSNQIVMRIPIKVTWNLGMLTKMALSTKPITVDPKCYTFLETRDTELQLSQMRYNDPVKYLLMKRVFKISDQQNLTIPTRTVLLRTICLMVIPGQNVT